MNNGQLAVSDPYAAAPTARSVSPGELGMGLQLVRASNMATTRLQLALIRDDRRQAMDALDWLLDIDHEIACFASELAPQADDPNWRAITSHLVDQKAAIACEKHALAGGISSPERSGAPALPEPAPDSRALHAAPAATTPRADPGTGVRISRWLLALLMLTVIGAVAAFLAMMLI